MKNKAYDLSSYSFAPEDRVLLDANIWLFLFPTPADTKDVRFGKYSHAFASLMCANAQPVIDTLVLSEYLNRYCRIERDAQFPGQKYKVWRRTSHFNSVALDAERFASRILNICNINSLPACNCNFSDVLQNFKTGQLDFNDAVFIDICKQRNLKFMTDDSDFQVGGIEILTFNQVL